MELPGCSTRTSTAGSDLAGPIGEVPARIVEDVGADSSEPARPQRAVVDRHRDPGAEQGQALRGGAGIQVVTTQPRSPAADGHQRDVEVGMQVRHPREEGRVTGEVGGTAAADDVAERLTSCPAPRPAPAVVHGGDHPDPRATDLEVLAGADLDRLDRQPSKQTGRSPGDDHRRSPSQQGQRRQVEVVGVQVGDQDDVDGVEEPLGHQTGTAVQVGQGRREHRIRQGAHLVVHEHGRVPVPGQPDVHGRPGEGRGGSARGRQS